MSGLRRIIVGASGSPGNLCALRYAGHLARATGATLIPVHTWIPPGGDVADQRCPSLYLRRVWTEDARRRLREALQAAWGQPSADLTIEPVVERGEPGAVLTSIANQAGDVLVIGAGRRGTLAHMFSGRVSRYCLAHAQVPIVAIPPPAAWRFRRGMTGCSSAQNVMWVRGPVVSRLMAGNGAGSAARSRFPRVRREPRP